MVNEDLSPMLCRPAVLFCLFACVSLASFLVRVDVAFTHPLDDGSVVVHVTEKGFEPRSVEVGAGETMVFENVDDEGHWPASDDHPTHEIYPAFDPNKLPNRTRAGA